MADKIYVVTLKKKDDLDGFYSDMESDGFKLQMKRPISRNTHYYMTDDQAVTLRNDSRVLAVELRPEDIPYVELESFANVEKINNSPHSQGTSFRKKNWFTSQDRDWGKLHCAGTDAQRRQYSWLPAETVTDNVDIFNDGRHVDVVICDSPVSFDCEEWKALSDNRDRFQMYDWYTELNQYISSIDDDGVQIPTAPYSNYFTNATNTTSHGTHVCGTAAGKWYGWAPEANIYSMQCLGNAANQGSAVPTLLIFDYLRAFHRNKPINLETGSRNPTITNHSWGYSSNLESVYDNGISISDIGSVTYRGTVYSSSNPNPTGWDIYGLTYDFGITSSQRKFNYHYAALAADVEDAIEDGVVIIGAAGNNNQYMTSIDPTDQSYVDWNNRIYFNNIGTFYWQRGSSPCNANGVINVGALSQENDFRRAYFSNFGPRIDVWAPGMKIVSCYNSSGSPDGKYGGAPNYYEDIQGTSMASPQVTGVAACIATGKTRFTNSDLKGYIQRFGRVDDMNFDIIGGQFNDATARGSNNGLFFDGDAPGLRADNPRPETGHMGGWYKDNLKGHRRHKEVTARGQVQLYPRVNQLYRELPQDLTAKTFNFTVTTTGGNYEFTGQDRQASHSNSYGATINMNVNDTVNFNLSNVSTSHPFYIKSVQGTGTGNQVTNPVANNQGATGTSTVTWTPSAAGTYYYQCSNHNGMNGQIIVT